MVLDSKYCSYYKLCYIRLTTITLSSLIMDLKSITGQTCQPQVKTSHTLYRDLWIKAFVNKSQYHVIKSVAELEMAVTIQLEVIATKHRHVFLWLYH